MKTHVNPIFASLFEKNLKRLAIPPSQQKLQQLVYGIYHEKEFITWLREKFSKEFTEETYASHVTNANFLKYIRDNAKITADQTEVDKRAGILERLQCERLTPVTHYEYDVDIVKAYYKLEKVLETVKYKPGFVNKGEFLENMKSPIVDHCVNNGLPLKFILMLS